MAEKEFKKRMQIIRTLAGSTDIGEAAKAVGVTTQTVRNALKKQDEASVTDKERECIIVLAKRVKTKQARIAALRKSLEAL